MEVAFLVAELLKSERIARGARNRRRRSKGSPLSRPPRLSGGRPARSAMTLAVMQDGVAHLMASRGVMVASDIVDCLIPIVGQL